jgi:hypothetical protein
MKITNLKERSSYTSPEVRVLSLGSEKVFADSGSKWDDADNSSNDFSIYSEYYNEFE